MSEKDSSRTETIQKPEIRTVLDQCYRLTNPETSQTPENDQAINERDITIDCAILGPEALLEYLEEQVDDKSKTYADYILIKNQLQKQIEKKITKTSIDEKFYNKNGNCDTVFSELRASSEEIEEYIDKFEDLEYGDELYDYITTTSSGFIEVAKFIANNEYLLKKDNVIEEQKKLILSEKLSTRTGQKEASYSDEKTPKGVEFGIGDISDSDQFKGGERQKAITEDDIQNILIKAAEQILIVIDTPNQNSQIELITGTKYWVLKNFSKEGVKNNNLRCIFIETSVQEKDQKPKRIFLLQKIMLHDDYERFYEALRKNKNLLL
jgi:hypothetical protein